MVRGIILEARRDRAFQGSMPTATLQPSSIACHPARPAVLPVESPMSPSLETRCTPFSRVSGDRGAASQMDDLQRIEKQLYLIDYRAFISMNRKRRLAHPMQCGRGSEGGLSRWKGVMSKQ